MREVTNRSVIDYVARRGAGKMIDTGWVVSEVGGHYATQAAGVIKRVKSR